MTVAEATVSTEVGPIPSDWDLVRLGRLTTFVTSGSRGWARYYSSQGPLFIRSQNVRAGQLDLDGSQFVLPPPGVEGDRTRVKPHDLLITVTGNSVGNVAHINGDVGEAYISQHVGLVRLSKPDTADFICRFLSPGSPGNHQIWARQSGQSKPGLTLNDLHELWVAMPPTEHEQRAIVAALSDVDGLIAALDKLIAKKRAIKLATMQQLLTGKTRLPGFSGEWDTMPFEDLRDKGDPWSITGGPFGSNLKSSDYTTTGVRIIQLQNIGDGQFLDRYDIYTSEEKADELVACNIYPGEIILSKMGDPVARACIIPASAPRYVMCSDGIRLSSPLKNGPLLTRLLFYPATRFECGYGGLRWAWDAGRGSGRGSCGSKPGRWLRCRSTCSTTR